MSPMHVLELASRKASGELIYATSSLEVHIFFQRGRIAWATDSKHPFAFAKHLKQAANIDEATFREVIETCRRDRLPLGETLVQWNLVSWEQVRASLRHQIERAFQELSSTQGGHTLFLDRGYSDYNSRLTFDPSEFLPANYQETSNHLQAPPEPAGTPRGAAGQLREIMEGLAWTEVLDDGSVVDADPVAEQQRTPQCVLQSTLGDGADFVAIRSAQGSLVGAAANESGRSLWCQLTAESSFGAAVSTLWTITSLGHKKRQFFVASPDEMMCVAANGDDAVRREVAAFLQSAPDILAAMILGDEPNPHVGFALPGVDFQRLHTLALKRSECLACPLSTGAAEPEDSLRSVGFYLKTMVSGEGDCWCFGAELGGDQAQTLWIFLERGCPQGLGWAYLSTLYRTLSHLPQQAVR